jgi:hypothetical protein
MAAGKILVLIGALLTLVSTFFLAFYHVVADSYASGIGFVFNIPDIIANPGSFGPDSMVVIIVAIVFIVFLLSGVIQLIGLVSRVIAFIGSFMTLTLGILILLVGLGVLTGDFALYSGLLVDDAIAPGIWPFNLPLGDVSLGTYTLIGGGALGLFGAIIGVKD